MTLNLLTHLTQKRYFMPNVLRLRSSVYTCRSAQDEVRAERSAGVRSRSQSKRKMNYSIGSNIPDTMPGNAARSFSSISGEINGAVLLAIISFTFFMARA